MLVLVQFLQAVNKSMYAIPYRTSALVAARVFFLNSAVKGLSLKKVQG